MLHSCISSLTNDALQNFGASILHTQFPERLTASDGSPTPIGRVDDALSAFFTAAFALELALNILANWPARFAADGWNWIDVAVVALSFLALAIPTVPAWLVELGRSARVIRLFLRASGLKRTIAAMIGSFLPILATYANILVITCMCKPPPSLSALPALFVPLTKNDRSLPPVAAGASRYPGRRALRRRSPR
jgi:hypothetical protein